MVRRATEPPSARWDTARVRKFLLSVIAALRRGDVTGAETLVAAGESELRASSEPLVRRGTRQDGPPAPGGHLARARRSVGARLKRHPWVADLALIALIALVEAGVLVWLQNSSFRAFRLYSLDIAVYNQALYTTAHSHQFFYYTVNLLGGNSGQLFAVHFSPFLLLLVPIYYLGSSIPTLLIIKQVALGLGALPTYALGRHVLASRRWGWVFAGAYLATPLMTGIDWVSFDPEVFLPLTLIATFYFFETRRTVPFLICAVAALSVIETVSLYLAIFAGVAFLSSWIPFSTHRTLTQRELRRFAVLAGVTSLVSLGIAYFFLTVVFSSAGAFGATYGQNFSVLGATSALDVPIRAIQAPHSAWDALMFDGNAKLVYLLLLFGCFGFLSLFGRWYYLVPALAWAVLASLSNNPIYYAFVNHLLAYAFPFLIAGAITGVPGIISTGRWISRRFRMRPHVRSRWKARWSQPAVGAVLIAAVVVTVSLSSPWLANPLGSLPEKPSGYILSSTHDSYLDRVISELPPGASVLTTPRLFPALSNRLHAYVAPTSELFLRNWSGSSSNGSVAFRSVTDWYLNMSQYVLLDFQGDRESALMVVYFGNLTPYGVRAAADGVYLYERGWTGPPTLWVPESFVIPAGSMTPYGNSVITSQNSSPYGPSLYRPPGGNVGSQILAIHGLGYLPPGEYVATFWWTVSAPTDGRQLNVSVKDTPLVFVPQPAYTNSEQVRYQITLTTSLPISLVPSSDLIVPTGSAPTVVGNFSLTFNWAPPGFVHFHVLERSDQMSLLVYALFLTQVAP